MVAEEGTPSPPPTLLTASNTEAGAIARIVQDAIKRSSQQLIEASHKDASIRPKRYYAATTKLLHFCFPGTFAIYDGQVGPAIEAWAKRAYPSKSDWQRFSWENTGPTDGSGYPAVIDFYRIFWRDTTSAQHAALSENARRLASEIGVKPGRLMEVDVIDGYLWMNAALLPAAGQ
jgi:hypothetical protein